MAKKAKPKAKKAKPTKRMSKGAKDPWEVWSLDRPWRGKIESFHSLCGDFKTQNQAEAWIKSVSDLIAPVIRHVDIPPMEY